MGGKTRSTVEMAWMEGTTERPECKELVEGPERAQREEAGARVEVVGRVEMVRSFGMADMMDTIRKAESAAHVGW